MKQIVFILLLLNIFFASCGQKKPKVKQVTLSTINTGVRQSYVLDIDDKKFNISQTEIIAVGYSRSKQLLITVLSKEKDIQFILCAYLEQLKPGTYQVYSCDNGPSKCDDETQQKGQSASFSTYPQDPSSDPSLFSAHNAPNLGLTPLTLSITSVIEDEPGMHWHSQRIEGNFSGSLAHVKAIGLNDWQVVGNLVKVNGKFNLYCAIR